MKNTLIALLLSCFSFLHATAYDFYVDGIYYNINGSEATVTYNYGYYGTVNIPESVTYDGTTYAVTSIGEKAFRNSTGLTSVNIPKSVTSIGDSTFSGCTGLTSVTIPESVIEIGWYAFSGCSGLTSLTIPGSVTSIGWYAFNGCSGITSVTIPESVTYIGPGAFAACTSLVEFNGKFASDDHRCLIVDEKLNSFAPSGLTSYSIPTTVTSIGNYAFENCTDLTSVNIPNTVTDIFNDAFRDCSGLTLVTIPNSVTYIGACAFYRCTGLTSIKVDQFYPATISLGSNVFYSVPTYSCILYVPEGSKELYAAADQWKAFYKIEEHILPVSLIDGESYTSTTDKEGVEVSYTRTFIHTEWQPLYVPFNLDYDEWSPYADVAKIHNLKFVDRNGDEVIDETVLEFSKLTSGELLPNVPYLIKPKATGTVTFECVGKNLLAAPAKNGSVNCSSTKEVFTLYGVYEPMYFALPDPYATTYSLVNGEFVATDAETEIPAGSVYLAITPKSGGYKPSSAPARVKIHIIGEEELLSGDANGDGKLSIADAVITVSFILGNEPAGFVPEAADLNGDSNITIADVVAIVSLIL